MTGRLIGTLVIETAILAVLLTLALDMRAHNRVERLGGVNIWGYRGPVMRRKASNEIRIAAIGGDLAFGWGVAASETMVYGVRQLMAQALDIPGGRLRRFTAVDLGAIGLAPSEYAGWIQHFAYLHPDVICFVPDARGHQTAGVSVQPDRRSPTFTFFGYAPILPLVLEEKGAALRAAPVRAAGRLVGALDSVVSADRPTTTGRESGSAYVEAVTQAVKVALAAGSAVVIVAPPGPTATDADDRSALAAMVTATFGREPRVRWVDLGGADMADQTVWLDGAALSAAGHARAAEHIAPAVLQLVRHGS